MEHTQTPEQKEKEFQLIYYNTVQLLAQIYDPTFFFAEVGRAGGKTAGMLGPRVVRVAHDMPLATLLFMAKTYASLYSNILPKLIKFFRTPLPNGKPYLTEGVHYVVGTKKLPRHFKTPLAPVENPQHCIFFAWGSVLRPGSADRAESVAGIDAAHVFIEEMKHIDGQKLKSRVFPTLRDDLRAPYSGSHYFQGITGVSDTARLDLGENDWFLTYEKNMNMDRLTDVANMYFHINEAQLTLLRNPNDEKARRKIERWLPLIKKARTGQTYYARASSFVNKDILGIEFFRNQLNSLTIDEFLVALGNIRPKRVAEMFFGKFGKKHIFDDSFLYDFIDKYDLSEEAFKITARDMKHYNPRQPLYFGYDPGHFMSVVVAQREPGTLRVQKDFHVIHPNQHDAMADEINEFYKNHHDRTIYLYYDRAGNQQKYKDTDIPTDTDAKMLARELRNRKWTVHLMSIGQETIYHHEHYLLMTIILSESERHTDRIRIDSNNAANLISSIHMSPLKRTEGRIQLDKSTEKSLPFEQQATMSPQIASAWMYLVYGLYSNYLPDKSKIPTDYDPQMI
ncbi:MAG: hypothetical protein Q8M66_03665 [Actinomycetota bacterium]|nr:hypothetical protein [Actinomycetota bacterium]